MRSNMTRSIGIYIFDDVEVLDFCGPFEVFSTACRVKARLQPDNSKPFEVFTIADTVRTVKARGGLKVQPHFDITNNPIVDVLIIPGGVISSELKRDDVIGWIAKTAATSTITASVCTGAFLLGKAGLLRKKTVTTHWADIDELRAMFPETTIQENIRWIDTGSIITSGGISAGIDMSLHLVSRLEGEELAIRTARQMEYNWQRI
jgi:transcriptional regulator GlxA family with amidase domain